MMILVDYSVPFDHCEIFFVSDGTRGFIFLYGEGYDLREPKAA